MSKCVYDIISGPPGARSSVLLYLRIKQRECAERIYVRHVNNYQDPFK